LGPEEAKTHAGDVLYPALLSGGTGLPFDDLQLIGAMQQLFDLFLDPDQLTPDEERAARAVVQQFHGKVLLRLM